VDRPAIAATSDNVARRTGSLVPVRGTVSGAGKTSAE
jgi:hypothetical protein